ncbi:MAG: DUF1830 domain-containing protein [Cyanobacteria bacterium J06650_10]
MQLLNGSTKIICGYTNPTSRIQILRISNIENWFFERAVIPQSSILFEAFQDAKLEVHTSEMMSTILSDVIPCCELTTSATSRRQRAARIPQTA